MNKQYEDNHIKASKLIKALFKGAGFSGFNFDTHFTLKFDRSSEDLFDNCSLPFVFEIRILSDWWFDNKDQWQSFIDKFDTSSCIEPDEPVKAFELARMRWSDGSDVKSVQVNESSLDIVFANDRRISISLHSEEDYAWILKESRATENKNNLSIVCEEGIMFAAIPNSI